MPAKVEKGKKQRTLEDKKLVRIFRKQYPHPTRGLTKEEAGAWMKYIRSSRAKYVPVTFGTVSMAKDDYQLMMDILSRNAPSRADTDRRRRYDRLMKNVSRHSKWWTMRTIVPPTFPNARAMRKKLTRKQLTAWRKLLERGYRS
jgi:hypothetical protein